MTDPFLKFAPPGHFYSPLPDIEEVRKAVVKGWPPLEATLPGIELRANEQLSLYNSFKRFLDDFHTFPEKKHRDRRYYKLNDAFGDGDGFALYSMIRQHSPKRIIEVGSGFTSGLMLDTNEIHFRDSIHMTFIEPYPQVLHSVLQPQDHERCVILSKKVQEVDPAVFSALERDDILFIDSSHISKFQSDVNFLVFQILPRLKPGVMVHFHDVFFPFDYPAAWLLEGRAWNENYLLRAFLQHNAAFRIELFSNYLWRARENLIALEIRQRVKNSGGSLWLSRVA